MVIVREQYPAISIDRLVAYMIGKSQSPDQLVILDVRPIEEFNEGHIIGAEPYPKALLSRRLYETESLRRAKKEGLTIVVCGGSFGAGDVVSTFYQRGYNAILLRGGFQTWSRIYPEGLLTRDKDNSVSLDVPKLTAQLALRRRPAIEKRHFLKATVSSKSRAARQDKQPKKQSKDSRRPWR